MQRYQEYVACFHFSHRFLPACIYRHRHYPSTLHQCACTFLVVHISVSKQMRVRSHRLGAMHASLGLCIALSWTPSRKVTVSGAQVGKKEKDKAHLRTYGPLPHTFYAGGRMGRARPVYHTHRDRLRRNLSRHTSRATDTHRCLWRLAVYDSTCEKPRKLSRRFPFGTRCATVDMGSGTRPADRRHEVSSNQRSNPSSQRAHTAHMYRSSKEGKDRALLTPRRAHRRAETTAMALIGWRGREAQDRAQDGPRRRIEAGAEQTVPSRLLQRTARMFSD